MVVVCRAVHGWCMTAEKAPTTAQETTWRGWYTVKHPSPLIDWIEWGALSDLMRLSYITSYGVAFFLLFCNVATQWKYITEGYGRRWRLCLQRSGVVMRWVCMHLIRDRALSVSPQLMPQKIRINTHTYWAWPEGPGNPNHPCHSATPVMLLGLCLSVEDSQVKSADLSTCCCACSNDFWDASLALSALLTRSCAACSCCRSCCSSCCWFCIDWALDRPA